MSALERLVNGEPAQVVPADDRGLAYGDGLFETLAVLDGEAQRLPLHLARLAEGAQRLGIPAPAEAQWRAELQRVCARLHSGVARLMLTRGPGPRGYRPPLAPQPTRVVSAEAMPGVLAVALQPLRVRVCTTRVACQPQLAGLKHLNRLEQVMAAAELDAGGHDEGLMCATDGRLVGVTAGNLFLVRDGRLLTPALADFGVAGTMRAAVLQAATDAGLHCMVGDLHLVDLGMAQGAFVCNALRGPRPLGEIEGQVRWQSPHPLCDHLRSLLGLPT